MYTRVVTLQIQPGKAEEAVRIFRDSVVPAAKQQPGFKSALLMTDSNGGKGIAITFWETEADREANEGSGYFQQQVAKVGQVVAAPPTRENYEVRFQG